MKPEPYVPPTGDEPLDEIEQALVRALVRALLAIMVDGSGEKTGAADSAQTPSAAV